MATLGSELQRSVGEVNEVAEASLGSVGDGPGGNPLPSIVRILNNQLQALTQVESRVGQLSAELENLAVLQAGGPAMMMQ